CARGPGCTDTNCSPPNGLDSW
nr:immunoglobulin heavy chain junction region [Macaca mulatta]MOW48300.1 immunoglobulin heavy chain junction region [Macaca mulatta]